MSKKELEFVIKETIKYFETEELEEFDKRAKNLFDILLVDKEIRLNKVIARYTLEDYKNGKKTLEESVDLFRKYSVINYLLPFFYIVDDLYFSSNKKNNGAITPKIRFELFRRDNFTCQYCGLQAQDGATLEIDHIIPVSKGGKNTQDNLKTTCRQCNIGKGDKQADTHVHKTKEKVLKDIAGGQG